MTQPLVFVNYEMHVGDDKANRRLVSTHIGKYHRNRSKPSQASGHGVSRGCIVRHQRKAIAPRALLPVDQSDVRVELSDPPERQSQAIASVGGLQLHYHQFRITMSPQINPHRLDPFQTGVVHLTPETEPIFRYYLNTIMPVVEPAPKERDDYQQWLVPLALSDSALMYALLRCMILNIEQTSVSNLGDSTRTPSYVEEPQYKFRAINKLNDSLADPIQAAKPSTMMAVHFWLWQEIFSGDECISMDDVWRLLEFRGGFIGIQRKAIEAVMVGSSWHAIRTGTKPRLSKIFDKTVIPIELLVDSITDKYPDMMARGQGLLLPELVGYFDQEFCHILRVARLVWICFELIGVHDYTSREKRSITVHRVNIDHRLLSYPFDHNSSNRPIQEVCRQTLVLYSNAHYNVVQPSSKIARCLIINLQAALEFTDMAWCWGLASAALLWSLFLGAHLSFGHQERPWFVAAISKVAQKSGYHEWVQVRQSLLQYYFSDRVFGASFCAIWAEARSLALLLNSWHDQEAMPTDRRV